MLRKTDSLTRGLAARGSCFPGFPAIAGAMIPSRLCASIGPDHDFPSLGISVDHPPHCPDDRLGTLLRNPQNPRRIERRCRPAVVHSDRLPHVLIIRGAASADFGRRSASALPSGNQIRIRARLQSCHNLQNEEPSPPVKIGA